MGGVWPATWRRRISARMYPRIIQVQVGLLWKHDQFRKMIHGPSHRLAKWSKRLGREWKGNWCIMIGEAFSWSLFFLSSFVCSFSPEEQPDDAASFTARRWILASAGDTFLSLATAAATLPQHPPKPSTMMNLLLTSMGTRLCLNSDGLPDTPRIL